MSLIDRLLPLYAPAVQRELYALGENGLKSTTISPALIATLIVIGFSDTLPRHELLVWLALMACATLAVLAIRRQFRAAVAASSGDALNNPRARYGQLVYYSVLGTAWGAISLLFDPAYPVQNAVIVIVLLGVLSVGAINIAIYSLPGYLLANATGTLFLYVMLPYGFGPHAAPLQWGLLAFSLIVANAGRNAHRALVHSIRLQFANDELLTEKAAAAERAERANREKSLFLAAASHDLRQPVHALLLLIEALRQRSSDASLRELITYMQQAGNTIGKLFSSLMELSRLESGSEKAELATLPLSEIVRAAVESHRLDATQRDLVLRLHLDRHLEGMWITTDRVLLERILDNLISNALRYTRHGGVLVAARRRHEDRLWIEVWDTGIGIAPHELERIFEPYYQVANPERDRRKGLGLGMAIVKRTAELLGIVLTIRSRPRQGSCFRLALPLAKPPLTAPESRPAANAQALPRVSGRRILVIDDDPMVLQAMGMLLGSWGSDYRCLLDYAAAIELIDRQMWNPEAILCDYRLPGERNGIEILDALTERCPEAAAILQTGELAPQVRDAAEDAGYLVLTKPVQGETLAATLEAVLRPR